jgi:hypothetical protein
VDAPELSVKVTITTGFPNALTVNPVAGLVLAVVNWLLVKIEATPTFTSSVRVPDPSWGLNAKVAKRESALVSAVTVAES